MNRRIRKKRGVWRLKRVPGLGQVRVNPIKPRHRYWKVDREMLARLAELGVDGLFTPDGTVEPVPGWWRG